MVFRVVFFGVFGGDPEGVSIWSECSAVFRFVRICSGMFRGVRSEAPAWVVVNGVRSWSVGRKVGIVSHFRSSGDGSAMGQGGSGGGGGAISLVPPLRPRVASHPPPNLPPSRGEGLNWGRGRDQGVEWRVSDDGGQGCFFQGVRGRSGGCLYLVGSFGGVQVCSDLFRHVQGCSERGSGVDGCEWGADLVGGQGGRHCLALSFFCDGSTIGRGERLRREALC